MIRDNQEDLRLALDGKYSSGAFDNLSAYLSEGPHRERIQAISLLGVLRDSRAVGPLSLLLSQCEESLRQNRTPLEQGSESRAFEVASETCVALARLDSEDAHRELVAASRSITGAHFRASAVSAMGFECNWHDQPLILRHLRSRTVVMRVAALRAIQVCAGPRLETYSKPAFHSLRDPSPEVVIAAVEVLALLSHKDADVGPALWALMGDKRYSRTAHQSVSDFVAGYFE